MLFIGFKGWDLEQWAGLLFPPALAKWTKPQEGDKACSEEQDSKGPEMGLKHLVRGDSC